MSVRSLYTANPYAVVLLPSMTPASIACRPQQPYTDNRVAEVSSMSDLFHYPLGASASGDEGSDPAGEQESALQAVTAHSSLVHSCRCGRGLGGRRVVCAACLVTATTLPWFGLVGRRTVYATAAFTATACHRVPSWLQRSVRWTCKWE